MCYPEDEGLDCMWYFLNRSKGRILYLFFFHRRAKILCIYGRPTTLDRFQRDKHPLFPFEKINFRGKTFNKQINELLSQVVGNPTHIPYPGNPERFSLPECESWLKFVFVLHSTRRLIVGKPQLIGQCWHFWLTFTLELLFNLTAFCLL